MQTGCPGLTPDSQLLFSLRLLAGDAGEQNLVAAAAGGEVHRHSGRSVLNKVRPPAQREVGKPAGPDRCGAHNEYVPDRDTAPGFSFAP